MTQTYKQTDRQTDRQTYIHMCIHMHTYMHLCVSVYIPAHIHERIDTYKQMCMYIDMHVHAHMYMCMYSPPPSPHPHECNRVLMLTCVYIHMLADFPWVGWGGGSVRVSAKSRIDMSINVWAPRWACVHESSNDAVMIPPPPPHPHLHPPALLLLLLLCILTCPLRHL